jgi:hypothetical protein
MLSGQFHKAFEDFQLNSPLKRRMGYLRVKVFYITIADSKLGVSGFQCIPGRVIERVFHQFIIPLSGASNLSNHPVLKRQFRCHFSHL